jgi:beta-mannosidase
MPGAVQLDWARAHHLPFPEYAGNVQEFRWMEDSYWLYRTPLDFPQPEAHQAAYLVIGGVDYQFEVRLDGKTVHTQEGMFTPVEIPLDAPGQILEVLVYPAPKSHRSQDDRAQANRSVKPAVSYGWDFHPRLVPLGIWQETYVELRSHIHFTAVETLSTLNDSLDMAKVILHTRLSRPANALLRWQLSDPQGETVWQVEKELTPAQESSPWSLEIEKPQLWWPNGQGPAALYTSTASLYTPDGKLLDSQTARIGFKSLRLRENPVTGSAGQDFPKGPNKAPITFEINGRTVFIKGSNWVNPDIFPGRITCERYRSLLTLAKQAHFNLLRCWGGAGMQKQAFFDLCDELGILVWQEFPLACNRYESESYLSVLDQESRSIIRQLRGHACLAVWCGGNELFNDWSGMTEQDLALRLLNRNTFDLDPERPFLMTAPLHGMGHGFYTFCLPDGREVHQWLPEARATAYSEFGVPGPAHSAVLRRIIPEAELFPPGPSPSWVLRHGFRAWDGSPTSWLELDTIRRYFGEAQTLEELVQHGQWIQAEGLRFFFEEARRQKPGCSLAANWCFNEPWPTAANGSLISWPDEPKPALEKVTQACRPVLASARAAKLGWRVGDIFKVDLFILNDDPNDITGGLMQVSLKLGDKLIEMGEWDFPGAPANTNLAGPTFEISLPGLDMKFFTLQLCVSQHPELNSEYQFVCL